MRFNYKIQLGEKVISRHSPVFIIAEAGVNHNGDIEVAKQLVDAAVSAGADAVKFQTFKTDNLILLNVEKSAVSITKPLMQMNHSTICLRN